MRLEGTQGDRDPKKVQGESETSLKTRNTREPGRKWAEGKTQPQTVEEEGEQ